MGARPLGLQAAMPTLPGPPRFIDNCMVPRHRHADVLVFQITQPKLVEKPPLVLILNTLPPQLFTCQYARFGLEECKASCLSKAS